jgi:cytochrome P450
LFTQARLNSFGPGRQEEMAYMVENIANHSHGGKLVEIRPIFHQLTSNIICHMLFGTRREKSNDLLGNDFDNFFQSNTKMLKIMNKLNISDLIPILKWFDLQGIERSMKHESNQIKKILSKILKEYRKGNKVLANSTSTDFVEILLSLDERLDDKSIMGVLTVCEYHCIILVLVRKYKLHFLCPLMLCPLFFFALTQCLLFLDYRISLQQEHKHLQTLWNGH